MVAKLAVVLSGPDLRKTTSRVAYLAKQDALAALDADLPGRKFTHWRPKLGVGYEITSDTTATLAPRPGGPWKVLDEGRSPGGKYSRKRRRFVAWGSTHGRHTWHPRRRLQGRARNTGACRRRACRARSARR